MALPALPYAQAQALVDAIRRLVVVRQVESIGRQVTSYAAAAQAAWDGVWPQLEAMLLDAVSNDPVRPDRVEAALAEADRLVTQGLAADPNLEQRMEDVVGRAIRAGYGEVTEEVQRNLTERERESLLPFEPVAQFTVKDEQAAAWLKRDSLFWVGDSWDQRLGQRISKATRESLAEGPSRDAVAAKLKERLTQFERPDSYWRLVGGAAIVRARSYGAVIRMQHSGVATFRFVAVMDERTSPICREMNGRIFTIEQASTHIERVTGATSPEAVKTTSPWVPPSQVMGKSPVELAAMGVILPPLHGNCRSKVVAESFKDTIETDVELTTEEEPEPEQAQLPFGAPPAPTPDAPQPGTRQLGAPDVRARQRYGDRSWSTAAAPDLAALGATLRRLPGPRSGRRVGGKRGFAEPEDARAMREEIGSMLAEYGMEPRDPGRGYESLQVFQARRLRGSVGINSGEMRLNGQVVRDGAATAETVTAGNAAGLNPAQLVGQAQGMRTVIHEHVHTMSKSTASAYARQGKVIEEVTTEVAARRILADQFPHLDPEIVRNPERFGLKASYQGWIDRVSDQVRKAGEQTGIRMTEDEAFDVIADAAVRMRRPGVNPAFNPTEAANQFADHAHPPGGPGSVSDEALQQFRTTLRGRLTAGFLRAFSV